MRRVGQTALLVLISASVVAQEKTNQPPIRSGVELVQLDVTVLDEQRKPVRGLTADDFTVLENGVRRPIRAFTAVDMPARTRAQDPVWAKEAAPDVATNQITEQEGRLVIILMDRSIPYMGGTVQAQKIAIAAVDQMGPHDVAAVISTSGGGYKPQNFTSDRARLVRAINQRDWSTESSAFPWSIDGGGDPRCFCGVCVLETLTNVSEAVRNMPRRRKVLFFIGRGITINMAPLALSASPGCEHEVKIARQKLFDSLAVSNLTIHSIDPRELFNAGEHTQASVGGAGIDRPVNSGPQVRMQALNRERNDLLRTRESLTVLPERTGGRAVVNTNTTVEKVAEIFQESDAYYVLGVERDPSSKPSLRRSLEVKVARRNVRAYAQRQFITPGAAPAVSAPSADASLSALLPDAGKPLALNLAAFAKPNDDAALVHITVDAGAFARHRADTVLEISAIAVDQTGVQQASVKQSTTLVATELTADRVPVLDVRTSMDLPAGDYEIRVAAADASAGTRASVFSQIVVPKFSSERLSLSDVVVETGPVAASSGAAPAGVSTTATTARAFAHGDQVRAFFQIYQGTVRTDAIVPVATRVRVLDARGGVVRDQSLTFAAADFQARRTDCRINLPIDNLTTGDYLLEIAASAGDHRAIRRVRFAVR
jgi:VWFA-related protein